MVAKPGGQLTVSGDQLLCRRHIRACSSAWTWTWICAPVLEQALTGCTSTWTLDNHILEAFKNKEGGNNFSLCKTNLRDKWILLLNFKL